MSTEPPPDLSPEQERQATEAMLRAFLNPPTIGLVGVSGTGKSSTINKMFRTDLPISHVVACTKEFRDTDLTVQIQSGEGAGRDVTLRVIDAPGLGEDVALDPTYLEMYEENLERCDVILWVLTARNRAVALDQMYLERLSQFESRIVFGINQSDLVDPLNWEDRTNLPSPEQLRNIDEIVNDRKEKLESRLGRSITINPYAANKYWKLQELYESLIFAAPKERAWMFEALKAFRHDEWVPEAVREHVRQAVEGQSDQKPREATRKSRGLFRRQEG